MVEKIPGNIERIVKVAKKELKKIYSNRMKGMVLYGSYARGDSVPESDIDLLLLLDSIDDISSERERYLPPIIDISLEYDTVITVIPMSIHEYKNKRTPLLLNIQKEGIAV